MITQFDKQIELTDSVIYQLRVVLDDFAVPAPTAVQHAVDWLDFETVAPAWKLTALVRDDSDVAEVVWRADAAGYDPERGWQGVRLRQDVRTIPRVRLTELHFDLRKQKLVERRMRVVETVGKPPVSKTIPTRDRLALERLLAAALPDRRTGARQNPTRQKVAGALRARVTLRVGDRVWIDVVDPATGAYANAAIGPARAVSEVQMAQDADVARLVAEAGADTTVAYVGQVAVPSATQARGVGTRLMTALVASATRRGAKLIYLHAYDASRRFADLERFYGRLGFGVVERGPHGTLMAAWVGRRKHQ